MFFADHETKVTTIPIPNGSAAQFLEHLGKLDGMKAVGVSTGAEVTEIFYDEDGKTDDDVMLAAALTDDGLLRHIHETMNPPIYSGPPGSFMRRRWIRHLLTGGDAISCDAFGERVRMERKGRELSGLERIPNLEVAEGVWMRVTNAVAASAASRLSRTAVEIWIEDRFDEDTPAAAAKLGQSLPEFYLLVDDEAEPTRAHVVVAAVRSDEPASGTVRGIEPIGHTTGYNNYNAYPEFADAIEALVVAEGLQYKPNRRGRPIEPEAAPPSP